MTARTARRLRQKNTAVPSQRRIFGELTRRLGQTTFWKSAGVEPQMKYAQFKTRIVPRKYDDLAPAVEKMKQGIADVLWPGPCSFYATSSGTTRSAAGGLEKQLPITAEMLAHFRQTGRDSLLYYTARVGNAGVFRGRHLFLSGSTRLTPLPPAPSFTGFTGDLSGIMALNLPASVENHFYEPGARIAQIADWQEKVGAIIARTSRLDITLLGGIPDWILLLTRALRGQSGVTAAPFSNLQQIWPNLECFVHSGVPVGPFADELRQALGPKVNFHEVYLTSEGLIAAQDGESRAGLRLMADAGIFYEFLAMDDFDEARLSQLANKIVPLEEVRVGVDYALLLTTPAGLCRYLIGDVVRFSSLEPPRLQYVGRTKLQLSVFGERVNEKELTDSLIAICQRNGWTIVNFHVAPLFSNPLYGAIRGRHEWWVELKPGTVITPTGPQMAIELDVELQRISEGYFGKRKGAGLEAPVVRLVMPGLFEHWMRHHRQGSAQHKVPRCRSDREMADQLAEIAQFAKD